MKVLVANLPGVKQNKDGSIKHYVKAGSRWPMTVGNSKSVDYYPFPFWLSYTSALLKRDTQAHTKGLDGVVHDMNAEDFLECVKEFKPDLLITELVILTLEDDLETLRKIKREAGTKIAVGGNYPTTESKSLLMQCDFIDFVFFGEYEFTAKELVESLLSNSKLATSQHRKLNYDISSPYEGGDKGVVIKPSRNTSAIEQLPKLDNIKGLVYRTNDGIVKQNSPRELIDLDLLPFPDRTDFPATIYPDFTLYSPCINIIATRGCPSGCVYCQERHILYNSPKYRMRKPENVVNEMEHCIKEFGARQFYFDDMSLVVNNKYTQNLCKEMIQRGIKIPWTCMGDAMYVTYETLKLMSEAGCIGMKFGVESANPEILKSIGKPLDLEKTKQVVQWCKELGIRTHATFCLGLPGETIGSIRKTMAYMKELCADTAQVSKAVPYPGTPMYRWAKENGYLITDDFNLYDGASGAILKYTELSNNELDKWYEIFCRKVSRQKLLRYMSEPMQSISIIVQMWKNKGFYSITRSIRTFIARAF